MDSQQAAFEKFKASGTGRKFPREQRNAGGMPSAMDGPVPDLYSIHHGKILPGFRKHGLVHKTQLSNHFVEHVADVVAVGDNVWVKVTSIQDDKIALSMKYVNQGEGRDLDPNLVQLSETEDKRRVHTGFVDRGPISIEEGGVLLKTVCKKCGAAGHLAAECFSGGERFELLRDDDDSDVQDRQTTRGEGRGRSSGKEKKKKDKNEDRDGGRGRRDKDKDKSRYREKDGHNRDRKERNEPSSGHRKEKRRDRSRSSSPRRDSDQQKTTKVESLEDALAVMRAHKVRDGLKILKSRRESSELF
ncbi:Nucleolar protein of 40 kDa [Gamsiella multidivaricata]|nr:Nucleolar protein of 40 kDa [Gamsiella multidivaricata]